MRAVMVREWTEFENLTLEYDVPSPPIGERQVRIDIKASAISIALTLFVTGRYQRKPPCPLSLGWRSRASLPKSAPVSIA